MRVVVTGAAGGIGRRVTDRLLQAGHDVTAVDRRKDALEALPDAVETVTVDLRDETAVENALDGIKPDRLITAAGWYEIRAIEDCSPAMLREHLEANLLTAHTAVHALLSELRRRSGRIIVIGSMVGRVPLPYHGAYSAAKAGLGGYVDSLRRELRSHDVGVVLVEPGPVSTGLNERAATGVSNLPDGPYRTAYNAFKGYDPESTDPETVAATVLTAATANDPKARYPVGLRARWLPVLGAILPNDLFDWLINVGMPDGILGRLIDR